MKTAPYLRTARLESKRRTARECIPSASAGRVPCKAARSRSQIFPDRGNQLVSENFLSSSEGDQSNV